MSAEGCVGCRAIGTILLTLTGTSGDEAPVHRDSKLKSSLAHQLAQMHASVRRFCIWRTPLQGHIATIEEPCTRIRRVGRIWKLPARLKEGLQERWLAGCPGYLQVQQPCLTEEDCHHGFFRGTTSKKVYPGLHVQL